MTKQRKPSILFYNFGARLGGAEIVLLEYLKQYSPELEVKVLLNEYGTFHDRLVEARIPVDVISTLAEAFYAVKREDRPGVDLLKLLPAALGLFFRTLKYLRQGHFDLVVSNTFKSHVLLGLAARVSGITAVWRFHDIIQREYEFNRFSWLNIQLIRFVLPSVKAVLPVSQAVEQSFADQRFDTSKFSVVHNGLEVQPGAGFQRPHADSIRSGWIGQFAAWKGIREFITLAVSLLEEKSLQGKELTFTIAGSALFGEEAFEKEIKELVPEKLSKHFKFLGHISDIDAFYDSIDVFFHTSIAPDPFPTTILEAGSRGKLVFASSLGGGPEIISSGEDGYLIDMREMDPTRKLVISVLSHVEDELKKGERLQERIAGKFSLSQYRHNFEQALLKHID